MSIYEIFKLNKRSPRAPSQTAAGAVLLILLAVCAGGLNAASIAYMETQSGNFGVIDLSTGVFSFIGAAVPLQGLGVAGGLLYGLGPTGTLYQVNTTTGGVSTVGSSAHSFNVFGSTVAGLFAIDNSTNVYSINAATGAATLLGPTGVPFGSVDSLSTNSSTLFWADGPKFYTLNTTTGAATLVGNMGGVVIGAMVQENGILYGGEFSPFPSVVTINTSTGGVTPGPGLSGTSNNFFGLAPNPLVSSVPEAETWTLLAVGMAVMALMRRLIKRLKS
jgi:hypothetical protein